MTEKQLLQHGFKKHILEDDVFFEQNRYYDHCLFREFSNINIVVETQPHNGIYHLAYLDSGVIIRNIPSSRLTELLHHLTDAEKAAAELKDIKTLLAPVFERWDKQNKNTQ